MYYLTVKGKDLPAGVLLGFAIALKFSPFLFLPYFLYRKRYKLVMYCVLTVLCIFFISLVSYGVSLHKIYLHYLRELSNIGIAAWSNQSIDAFLLRAFTNNSIFSFAPLKITTLFSMLRAAILLSVVVILLLLFRRREVADCREFYPLEFSAVILCLLIIPSISWVHYFMLAILSIVLIGSFYFRIYPYRAKIIIPLTILSYAMIALHPHYAALVAVFGQGFLTKFLVSLPFLGTCLMLFINVALMKIESTHLLHKHS
jgi:hypothetical protein